MVISAPLQLWDALLQGVEADWGRVKENSIKNQGVSSETQRPSDLWDGCDTYKKYPTSTSSNKLLGSTELPSGQQSERELTRQMAHHRDAQFHEIICIPNTREHEQLWRVDGAPAQDHLPADVSLEEAEVYQSHFLKSQLFSCLVERHPVPAITMRPWPLEITPLWRICSQVLDRGERREQAGWLAT